jgi:hypothetical protein
MTLVTSSNKISPSQKILRKKLEDLIALITENFKTSKYQLKELLIQKKVKIQTKSDFSQLKRQLGG